jgi:ribulose-phosphate 3-epimerase
VKIVPSVLSKSYDDFVLRLRQAEPLTDYVQIDIMDGSFVGTRSFPAEMISGVETGLSFEVHLMVQDPQPIADKIRNRGLRKVIYHFESRADHDGILKELRGRGIDAGLAIRPETTVEEFRDVGERVGTLLFLTVDPGKYGSPFRPEVLAKVAEARRVFPRKTIAVDGGVSTDNLHLFYDIGVDYVCVGSRIFLVGKPEDNFRKFMNRLKEIEDRRL